MLSSEEPNTKLIGIFGGSFDPIHNGHTQIISSLLDKIPFDEIKIIPCGLPAHRSLICSAKDRIEMVRLAFSKIKKISIDDREIMREGFTFSIDTVKELKKEFPEKVSFVWIMGEDAFQKIDTWHMWKNFINQIHIIVISRPNPEALSSDVVIKLLKAKKSDNVGDLFLHNKKILPFLINLDISSSIIRKKIKKKENIKKLVFPKVLDYIEHKELYL